MYLTTTLLANTRRIIKLYDSKLKPVCSRYARLCGGGAVVHAISKKRLTQFGLVSDCR